MKVTIDADTCTGCELCTTIAPEVFEMDGDVAKAIQPDVPASEEANVNEAAESCPVESVIIS